MASPSSNCVLPKIPGMGFGEELLRTDYRKRQYLNSGKEVSSSSGATMPGITQVFDTMKVTNPAESTLSSTKKISLDRKVLRFQGYYREAVHESPLETERLRRCLVYYFLEDDTLSVCETKQDNSGIAGQGAIIKRHQIKRPDGQPYSFEDLNIGRSIVLYAKTFYLTDCDDFTRKFLCGMGIEVPPPEDLPTDQYTETRRKQAAAMGSKKAKGPDDMDFGDGGMSGRRTKLTSSEITSTKQFLALDKQVLKFHCVWDDRSSLYGDIRLFVLQYFLADDTIVVTESNPPNCGRDPFPSFVKRSKVPKITDGKYVDPNANLLFKKEAVSYLTDADLMIGVTVNVYGREFLIYDCDDFTQKHLREKFGITDFTPVDVRQSGPPKIPVEPPPYNGFGDELDSLGSWKYLVLKAPKKDIKKYMEHANHQLKFQLRLDSSDETNAIRRFVLTYFMADDTLSIFEPAQRNTGIIGGKFLQRSRVKKNSSDGVTGAGEYITPKDLFVGARVTINNHQFIVYSTDERTLALMEENPGLFPKCNIDLILTKLRAMLLSKSAGLHQAFETVDKDKSGALDFVEFANIIETLRLDLAEQEILTVMRHFDRNSDGQVSWAEFLAAVLPPEVEARYDQLKQESWDEIQAFAEKQEADELDRFHDEMAGSVKRLNYVSDMAFREFLEKYNQRRILFHDTFKVVADHSPDGNIGEPEFRRAVQKSLKLDFQENALKALVLKLFPASMRRIPLPEFKRILAGTSTLVRLG